MCGIIGYIVTKPQYAEKAKRSLTHLLMEAEVRGSDAAGAACLGKETTGEKLNYLHCVKAPLPAFKFVADKNYRAFLKKETPIVMIGHTRAHTQGDPQNNDNNHPIITNAHLALVHNGMIVNDTVLFNSKKIDRNAKVDSEIIPALIEQKLFDECPNTIDAIKGAAKEIRGSMTCAMISAYEPDTLYLWASTNPLWLAYQKSTGTLFFGSTKEILQYSLFRFKKHYKMFYVPLNQDDFFFKQVEDNTGYKLTPKGPEEFKIERPSFYPTSGDYSGKGYLYNRDNYDDEGYFLAGKNATFPPTTPSLLESKKLEEGEKKDAASKIVLPHNSNRIHIPKNKKNLLSNSSPDLPIRKPGKYDTLSLEERLVFLYREDHALTDHETVEAERIMRVIEMREDYIGNLHTVN